MMIEALFFITLCCIYAFVIWKFGIKGLWNLLETLVHRIVDGPPPPAIRPGACMHLHLTAKAEWEVYGKVVSESIQDHMATCSIRIADMPFGQPDDPFAAALKRKPLPKLPNPGRVERG